MRATPLCPRALVASLSLQGVVYPVEAGGRGALSTPGTGEFTATIAPDGDVIPYTATYSGLQGTVTQSHIHVGQLGVNGSIVIFLCQTAANPDPTGLAPVCPQQGSVSGEITTANVIAGSMAPQQLAAGTWLR
jgi:CHRD domain